MSEGDKKPEIEKRLEKISDFHFVEHWEEGERPFNWYAQWESICACGYAIEIWDMFHIYQQGWALMLEDDLTQSIPPGLKEGLSKEEREKFVNFFHQPAPDDDQEEFEGKAQRWRQSSAAYNQRFQLPETPHYRRIHAKFSLEDDRRIGTLVEGEPAPSRFPGEGKGTITIDIAEGPQIGSFGFVVDRDIEWDQTTEPDDGDLWLHFYIPENQFDHLVERIQEIGSAAVFVISFEALVFQGEVDRNLGDPFQHKTFFIERGKYSAAGDAVPEWIRVETPKPTKSMPIEGYRDAMECARYEAEKANPPSDQQASSAHGADQRQINLRPIILALWAIFFGLVLNAIS